MTFEVKIKTSDPNAYFDLEFNGQKITADPFSSSAVFEYDENKEYILTVTKLKSRPLSMGKKILYCILGIFEAIIYIICQDPDNEWYSEISPYCIKKQFRVTPEDGKSFCLFYKNGRLDRKPELECAVSCKAEETSCEYIEDKGAFDIALFNRIRKITAICIYSYVLFGFLTVIGILKDNILAAAICAVVFAATIIANVYCAIKARKTTASLVKIYDDN